ncbi:MAG TPA: hypothetical protein VF997_23430 [Polyangia bacterium]
MGKLVAAFVFFLAASALAIHESKPPPSPERDVASPPVERAVDAAPPSRAIHDAVPPWVKYAAPPAAAPSGPTIALPLPPPPPPRSVVTIDDGEIGDVLDVVDKCPDQPTDNDDSDGCPEPQALADRIILID